MTTRGKQTILVFVLVFFSAFGIRAWDLGSFLTVDETRWMLRSAEYWGKLTAGDPAGTFVTTHPGATVTVVAGTGIMVQESRLGLDLDTPYIGRFHRAALWPLVLLTSLVLALIAVALAQLIPPLAALVSGLLLALDPYLLGLTQIVHLDGILALTMAAAAVAWLAGRRQRSLLWLGITGICTGLALGTKMLPAFWLLVFFAGSELLQQRLRIISTWKQSMRSIGFVAGVAVLVFIAVWPALWAKTDNLDEYVQREFSQVVVQEHVAFEESTDPIAPGTFYVRTLAGRVTTANALVGIATVLATVVWYRQRTETRTLWLLVLFALGFIILVSFVPKKSDRYIAPALAMMPLLTGWSIMVLGWWVERTSFAKRAVISFALGLVVIAFVTTTLQSHVLAYNNSLFPNVRHTTQQGWGEGLERAAAWLNERPRAADTYVASWYPGVLTPFFVGNTLSLSSRDDPRVKYVITYRNMQGRGVDSQASAVLDEFKDREPIHTVMVNGQPYVWIYETETVRVFDSHIGELVGGVEVGQTVMPHHEEWSEVDVAFATFSSRNNQQDVILNVYEDIDAKTPLRTAVVNAREIIDNEWQRFTFEPIAEAGGQEFYISITSPNSRAGDAVTVRYADADVKAGQMVLLRRGLQAGESRSDFIKAGDIAYRLP